MRLIGLLLALAILGYVIKVYLGTSGMSSMEENEYRSHPRQTIDQAEQATEKLNQALQDNQQRLDEADK